MLLSGNGSAFVIHIHNGLAIRGSYSPQRHCPLLRYPFLIPSITGTNGIYQDILTSNSSHFILSPRH